MLRRILQISLKSFIMALLLLAATHDSWGASQGCAEAGQYPLSARYLSQEFDIVGVPGATLEQLVSAVSRLEGLDKDFLWSVMCVESAGDPYAVSPKGAVGLLQILPSTAAWLGITDKQLLTDPWINLRVGAKYLRTLLDRYNGDYQQTVTAYHAGPGRVKSGKIGKETRRYVQRVLSLYQSAKYDSRRAPHKERNLSTAPRQMYKGIFE
jgi:soluble lytic murein transglycosylase-like protein